MFTTSSYEWGAAASLCWRDTKGLIGFLYQPLSRLTGYSLRLFGYLHELASMAPALQKASTSLAPEERGNRSHVVSLAAMMQERAWGPASRQTKVTDQAS